MKRLVILCGLLAGAINSSWRIFFIEFYKEDFNFSHAMILGIAANIISFALIFVAVKNYRDNHNNGFITFTKAIQIGLLITLIGSTMYVAAWLFEYFYIVTDFAARYTNQVINAMKASGASPAAVNKTIADMADFSRKYNNPLYNAMVTYEEIAPIGIIMTLLAALILKRKAKVAVGVPA